MEASLNVMRNNFQEIFHAVQISGRQGIPLVANISGTRIYDSTRGWGRLWRLFYAIVDDPESQCYRFEKLKDAMIYTHRIFCEQKLLLQHSMDDYCRYLERKGIESDGQRGIRLARRKIRLWNQSTEPFIKLMRHNTCPKLNLLFQACFSSDIEAMELWNNPCGDRAKSLGSIIDIEGASKGPLPLTIFRKILSNEPLEASDNQILDRWIKQINQVAHCVYRLDNALKYIAGCYQDAGSDENIENAVCRLEVFLEDKGCKVFSQIDKDHMQWRQDWQTGAMLVCGERQWQLMSQIPSRKIDGDATLVFALDDPRLVAVVAQNPVALRLRQFRQCIANQWKIKPIMFSEVFEQGRWAIMKYCQPVTSHQWQSMEGMEEVQAEDRGLFQLLSSLIKRCITENTTPMNFDAANLCYDSQEGVASLKPFRDGPFDFNALEDFAISCAAGNHAVFKQLMRSSGLLNHPVALFYHDLVKSTLKGARMTVKNLAAIYRIVDPKVIHRGKLLVDKTQRMRDALMQRIKNEYPCSSGDAIRRQAKEELMNLYEQSMGCGIMDFEIDTKCYN